MQGPSAHLDIRAGTGAEQEAAALQALAAPQQQQQQEGAKAALCRWQKLAEGEGLELMHPHSVSHVTWHARGDYFASVAPAGNTQVGGVSVLVQQRGVLVGLISSLLKLLPSDLMSDTLPPSALLCKDAMLGLSSCPAGNGTLQQETLLRPERLLSLAGSC